MSWVDGDAPRPPRAIRTPPETDKAPTPDWKRITEIVHRLRELDVPESALEPIERWRDEHCEKP